MTLRTIVGLAAATLLVAGPAPGQTPALFGIGHLNGGSQSSISGVSADGGVAVGFSTTAQGFSAVRWSATGGLVALPDFGADPPIALAAAVSADGGVTVGNASVNGLQERRAARWVGGSIQSLFAFAGGNNSYATATSQDGSVIAGSSSFNDVSGTGIRGFRWTQATGLVALDTFAGGGHSFGRDISADGQAIAGSAILPNNEERAALWNGTTGAPQNLGVLPGGDLSRAAAISTDGATVVGFSKSAAGDRAIRWTATGGLVDLGTLSADGSPRSEAYDVSADGSVVVGLSTPVLNSAEAAVIFDGHGVRTLASILQDNGLATTGWTFTHALAISGSEAAGYTIAGRGMHNGNDEGFVATGLRLAPVPEPAGLLGAAVAIAGLARSVRRIYRRSIPVK